MPSHDDACARPTCLESGTQTLSKGPKQEQKRRKQVQARTSQPGKCDAHCHEQKFMTEFTNSCSALCKFLLRLSPLKWDWRPNGQPCQMQSVTWHGSCWGLSHPMQQCSIIDCTMHASELSVVPHWTQLAADGYEMRSQQHLKNSSQALKPTSVKVLASAKSDLTTPGCRTG